MLLPDIATETRSLGMPQDLVSQEVYIMFCFAVGGCS